MPSLRFLHRSKGFTLVELLVVLGIMSILSGILLAGYNGFSRRQDVKNASQQLLSELRKYQVYAFATQKHPDPNVTTCSSVIGTPPNQVTPTVQNYTVTVTTTSYNVEINCSPASPQTLQTIFPWNSPNVEVNAVGTDANTCGFVEIVFLPLNQGTEVSCDGSPTNQIYIQVVQKGVSGGARYKVYVTTSGNIYETKP